MQRNGNAGTDDHKVWEYLHRIRGVENAETRIDDEADYQKSDYAWVGCKAPSFSLGRLSSMGRCRSISSETLQASQVDEAYCLAVRQIYQPLHFEIRKGSADCLDGGAHVISNIGAWNQKLMGL